MICYGMNSWPSEWVCEWVSGFTDEWVSEKYADLVHPSACPWVRRRWSAQVGGSANWRVSKPWSGQALLIYWLIAGWRAGVVVVSSRLCWFADWGVRGMAVRSWLNVWACSYFHLLVCRLLPLLSLLCRSWFGCLACWLVCNKAKSVQQRKIEAWSFINLELDMCEWVQVRRTTSKKCATKWVCLHDLHSIHWTLRKMKAW
jgi:hypothetical protein